MELPLIRPLGLISFGASCADRSLVGQPARTVVMPAMAVVMSVMVVVFVMMKLTVMMTVRVRMSTMAMMSLMKLGGALALLKLRMQHHGHVKPLQVRHG